MKAIKSITTFDLASETGIVQFSILYWSHLKGEVTLPPRLQFDCSLYWIYWAAVKFISGTSANWVVDKQAITCFGLL